MRRVWRWKRRWLPLLFLACGWLSGCAGFSNPLPTPIPSDALPTVIAQTYEASLAQATPVPITPSPTEPASEVIPASEPDASTSGEATGEAAESITVPPSSALVVTATLAGTGSLPDVSADIVQTVSGLTITLPISVDIGNASAGITVSVPLTTPLPVEPSPTPTLTPPPTPSQIPPTPTRTPTPKPTPTITPTPGIPEGEIRIYKPGELSKVSSPMRIFAVLTSRTGKRLTIDLLGEDGRLLTRQVKVFPVLPWKYAELAIDLDFGIWNTAEVARLVLRMDDEYGRTMSLNSVNVVLLSVGESDLYPSSALLEAVAIQQPQPKALIQGKRLLVTGKARLSKDQPLHVQLLTEQGLVVGERLVNVGPRLPGGYGSFSIEVPYTVTKLTPVRLVVYEPGDGIYPILHLSSLEIFLSP